GLGSPLSIHQEQHYQREQREAHAIRAPHVERIPAHRKKFAHWLSTISQRTRAIATAIEYIQNAAAMRIMPANMVAAMLGARVKLTEAPWCSVFHHCTEK